MNVPSMRRGVVALSALGASAAEDTDLTRLPHLERP
jgi:hypothetical protein